MTPPHRFRLSFAAAVVTGLSIGACSSDNPSGGSTDRGSGSATSASGSATGASGSTSGSTGGSGSLSGGSGAAGSGAVATSGASSGVSASGSTAGSGSVDLGEAGTTGSASGGSTDGGSGSSNGVSGSSNGDGGTPPPLGDAGAHLVSLFDGTSTNGWVQVPAASWSVVNGALHSLGTARGVMYTTQMYGDFRFVFTSRLISTPIPHYPCVLFWGNALNADALHGIQVQPPAGYMWDYRAGVNKAPPPALLQHLAHPNLSDTQWSRCEMLGNKAAGRMRFACCQLVGTATTCKATEIVVFTDPTAGQTAPLALQVHNPQMIEEFKDLYVESPVADPTTLLTTQ
ncbi:MAG: DUF1080 domain-containing protein [Myxococcota bacterium]|nr:DUF1080 domain-containing protein [Myxococcota bacterium]